MRTFVLKHLLRHGRQKFYQLFKLINPNDISIILAKTWLAKTQLMWKLLHPPGVVSFITNLYRRDNPYYSNSKSFNIGNFGDVYHVDNCVITLYNNRVEPFYSLFTSFLRKYLEVGKFESHPSSQEEMEKVLDSGIILDEEQVHYILTPFNESTILNPLIDIFPTNNLYTLYMNNFHPQRESTRRAYFTVSLPSENYIYTLIAFIINHPQQFTTSSEDEYVTEDVYVVNNFDPLIYDFNIYVKILTAELSYNPPQKYTADDIKYIFGELVKLKIYYKILEAPLYNYCH